MRKKTYAILTLVAVILVGCQQKNFKQQLNETSSMRWRVEAENSAVNISSLPIFSFGDLYKSVQSGQYEDKMYVIKITSTHNSIVKDGKVNIPVAFSVGTSFKCGDSVDRRVSTSLNHDNMLFIISKKSKNADDYIGQTALGAVSKVTKIRQTGDALFFEVSKKSTPNPITSFLLHNSSGVDAGAFTDMQADAYLAFKVKANACGDLIGTAYYGGRPTLDTPIDYFYEYRVISAEIGGILLVDKNTGVIRGYVTFK